MTFCLMGMMAPGKTTAGRIAAEIDISSLSIEGVVGRIERLWPS